jgi:hypothetical protein
VGNFQYYCVYHGFTGAVTVQAAASPPTVTLTNPPNGAVLSAPASLLLAAAASDSDGSVTNVAFFNGAALLGNVAGSPYTLALSNLAAGVYTFSAVATDNGGLSATNTATVHVVTAAPLALGAAQWTSGSGFQFSFSATPGLSYVIQRSADLAGANWVPLATNTAGDNTVTFQDAQAPATNGFYRVGRRPNP